jgi:hypothetical protein
MPLPSSWVVVVVRRSYYSTHQNHLGSCMSVPPSERIELALNTHSYACFHKQNMYDENSIGTKVQLGQRKILGLRISCAQLKTTRIHDSSLQTDAGVWSNLIFNLESTAKANTCGEFGTGGHILAVGNKNPQLQTPEFQKFSQISLATQWHNYACFWYSKIDLDWIGIYSKNFICGRGRAVLKSSRTKNH